MKINNKIFVSLAALIIIMSGALAYPQQEKVTLTTYYPAPYGDYNELRAKKELVGYDTTNNLFTGCDLQEYRLVGALDSAVASVPAPLMLNSAGVYGYIGSSSVPSAGVAGHATSSAAPAAALQGVYGSISQSGQFASASLGYAQGTNFWSGYFTGANGVKIDGDLRVGDQGQTRKFYINGLTIPKIARGALDISASPNLANISYGTTFSSPPVVVACISNGGGEGHIMSISAGVSSCAVTISYAIAPANPQLNWIAVGD